MIYDFYSDTKTKPSLEMRKTVLNCEVGDEQKAEDPTTIALCRKTAELLGKEAAVFLPSGTMCNEIAIKVHTRLVYYIFSYQLFLRFQSHYI